MHREHLERAAVSYAHLRGLLLIPLGALLIVAALANEEILPAWAFPAALVAAAPVCWLIVRHYREHYGRVRLAARQQTRDLLAVVLAIAVVIAASVVFRDSALNPIAIAFAVALATGYALGAGLRTHQVVILGALFVAGAVPIWDGDDSANAGLAVAGVAIGLLGVFDHRAFLHTFGSPVDA